MEAENAAVDRRVLWSKGKLSGQKPPLNLQEIWAIRMIFQMASNTRELAMLNLAIDNKPRACDLTRLQVQDIPHGSHVAARTAVMQHEDPASDPIRDYGANRESLEAWIEA